MQKTSRTLVAADQKATWATGAKKTIRVPLNRWVSVILLRCSVTYDTAAAATKAQDGVLNFLKNIVFKVNGSPRRSWNPNRYWYKLPLDLRVQPEFVDVTTTVANGKKASVVVPIYFRLDKENEDDVSALLPAGYLSSVEVEVEFGATAAFGTNQTIVSGDVDVTLKEIDLSASEEVSFYGRSGTGVIAPGSDLKEVIESEISKTVDASYSDYKFNFELPTGSVLLRTLIFATLNGIRDDTLITFYKVRNQRAKYDYVDESWAASQARDLMEYGPVKAIEGNFYLVGLTIADHLEYGPLDLRGERQGDVVIAATVIAPVGTTNIVLHNEEVREVAYASA